MSSPRNWQHFFDAHAESYDQNGFTSNTSAEVDFILTLYPISPKSRILDVGCGTGRHAVEFGKRGYQVTGIDLSEKMLEVARQKARLADVSVEWIHADATEFSTTKEYDLAVCLCEGAVGLIEKGEDAEEHDGAIFRNIWKSLKPNAPFVLTALNGYSTIRQMKDEFIAEGRFDPDTMVSNYEDQLDLPDGPVVMRIYERLFIAPEMVKLLNAAGFTVDNIYGGTAGHWARRFLSLDEVEAMYLCRKSTARL
jgi:SAM-dependent methyltransferase